MKIPSSDPESAHPIGLYVIWFMSFRRFNLTPSRCSKLISCPDSESPQITSLDTWPLLGGVISCQGKGDGLSISARTRPPKSIRKFIYTI